MYKRYYRKYNDEGVANESPELINETEIEKEVQEDNIDGEIAGKCHHSEKCHVGGKKNNIFDIFKHPKLDDIVLLALIFIFLQDCMDDEIVLVLLIFLFVSGI